MRFAYLTTAYHQLAQLRRLQEALRDGDPEALRVVQFDISAPLAPRAREVDAIIRYTRRPVNWGDGSYVDALLHTLSGLLAERWDWLFVLSGQDYPVRPLSELHALVEQRDAVAYSPTGGCAISASEGTPETIRRYFYRYRAPQRPWPAWARRASRIAAPYVESGFGSRVRLQPRPRGAAPAIGVRMTTTPFSAERPCYQGSDYVSMRRSAVVALLDLVDSEPELLAHLRSTFVPSEAFFATGLRWLFGSDVDDAYFHFMRFGGRANPRLLTPADRDEIAGSRRFFARKLTDESSWVESAFTA